MGVTGNETRFWLVVGCSVVGRVCVFCELAEVAVLVFCVCWFDRAELDCGCCCRWGCVGGLDCEFGTEDRVSPPCNMEWCF